MLISRQKKSQSVVGIGGSAGEQEIKYKLPHEKNQELLKIFVVFRITYQKQNEDVHHGVICNKTWINVP